MICARGRAEEVSGHVEPTGGGIQALGAALLVLKGWHGPGIGLPVPEDTDVTP